MAAETEDTREAEALFRIVSDRYGDKLNPEQLDEVRKGVDGATKLARELRGVRLDNGVEPFSTFRPYRGDENHD